MKIELWGLFQFDYYYMFLLHYVKILRSAGMFNVLFEHVYRVYKCWDATKFGDIYDIDEKKART